MYLSIALKIGVDETNRITSLRQSAMFIVFTIKAEAAEKIISNSDT